ncbi:MAG TPA: hypothetical protein VL309_08440 [Vicinamibacterales bacterium]|jgi:hypothetical protein|nr:hypothetical protein [Vicinamibacterales bacterium]
MARFTSTIFTLVLTLAGLVAHAAGDTRAEQLLAQARAAIGAGKNPAPVRGLSCAGTVQRLIGDRQIAGDLTIDLQLPDKMLRSESISPMGDGAVLVTDQGVNGETLLRRAKTLNMPPGAVIRMPPPPEPGSDAEAQALRSSRAEMARIALALLLASPAPMPLEFAYAGEAESPDGRADVVGVTGPSNFAAQLFLDKASHRPLMLTYRGIAPQIRIQAERAPGPQAPEHANDAARPAAPSPGEVVDITMYLDDYRAEDGVLLPHHLSRSVDGQTTEEWTFKTIKVNPMFKADAFSIR